jgi:hypothetical protein
MGEPRSQRKLNLYSRKEVSPSLSFVLVGMHRKSSERGSGHFVGVSPPLPASCWLPLALAKRFRRRLRSWAELARTFPLTP